MMEWWVSRAPRERILLLSAGVLTGLVGLFVFVLQPVSEARASAQIALDSAVRDLALVQREVTAIGGASGGRANPAPDGDRFRSEMTLMAQRWGITVSRLQGSDTGTLLMSMDETSPETLFAWLSEIRNRPGGEVISATLSVRGESTIRAVIELRGTLAS